MLCLDNTYDLYNDIRKDQHIIGRNFEMHWPFLFKRTYKAI